ncbi:MAG: NADH-quinone oxidoreductase subunit L [Rhodospirillaceae bacterium]|jgi:NADH-quinone oxidoreductase subunit L|nr:NADH-quinone oxidoreductase subunit L [Rhodospirillaceae bacterium]
METAAVFLPLVGAIIAGFFGRHIGDRASQIVTCLGVGSAAVLSVPLFFDVAVGGNERVVNIMSWINSGTFETAWALRFDTLSAVMVMTVTCVSSLIHVYSIGYMSQDDSKPRFMAYLSLFTFAMLMLVTSDNLVQLFFGWEGVGVVSYLLIGFWFKKPTANAAAIKAFVVNRVGDFGFLLGIFGIYMVFDAVTFDTVFNAVEAHKEDTVTFFGIEGHALTLISLLLFIGAMGKSAQLFLHTWLPDAMEGPTPVSALIHAATMVTAGVFLVARMSPVFEYAPSALEVVTIVGASTAFFAATIGCVQTDIKRVIAYSTCSQLGYMFFACGIGAYPAAIFHLMTHAWFKALLFLGAGSVIHAMSDEQDMRKMGGIWKHVKITYAMMWIGTLALVAVPPFAGYYSKDLVLEAAYGAQTSVGQYAFIMGIAAALLTAFYSGRLLLLTFHGEPRADKQVMEHVHESPLVMTIPLMGLALGAIFAGMVGYDLFVGEGRSEFWRSALAVLGEDPIEAAHHVPAWVVWLPMVVTALGLGLSYHMYMRRPDIPGRLAAQFPRIHQFLLNKWYFDELYDFLFVRPAFWLGNILWKRGDEGTIDRFGPNGISSTIINGARRLGAVQSGYLYHYAFAMIIGIALFVSWTVVGG